MTYSLNTKLGLSTCYNYSQVFFIVNDISLVDSNSINLIYY